ncbi:macro domain-containing protein [Butyrivibrio sp. VCD2006]|uniref:macro domain-containing protein n=1 Tax=Butyrivibrio sp. VCD2006 TaxID=1280664 RepID=UPI001A9A3AEF|nr:macro domain-containing protein [Butyrivibrio sp. VCD2006]
MIDELEVDAIVDPTEVWPIRSVNDLSAGVNKRLCLPALDYIIETGKETDNLIIGQIAITPGYGINTKFIIHVVFPKVINGDIDMEQVLKCYENCLRVAVDNNLKSIAFLFLLDDGCDESIIYEFQDEIDRINSFLEHDDIDVYLNFEDLSNGHREIIKNSLNKYIEEHYQPISETENFKVCSAHEDYDSDDTFDYDSFDKMEEVLSERIDNMTGTFSEFLLQTIRSKGMTNADVYRRAIVDKKVFSKIKNNPEYHPQKMTALCLCIGAKLNLKESKELLARAGYALSPCDKTDVIFSFFIENGIYDMIELDIQLEEHGMKAMIS